jgi:hypothetical protein
MSIDNFLFILSFICFVIAAVPHNMNIRFEWLGVAFLVLTYII